MYTFSASLKLYVKKISLLNERPEMVAYGITCHFMYSLPVKLVTLTSIG